MSGPASDFDVAKSVTELLEKLERGRQELVLRWVRESLHLDGDETFETDPETEKMLLDAIAQCDRGETIPLAQLLGELRSRE